MVAAVPIQHILNAMGGEEGGEEEGKESNQKLLKIIRLVR